MTTRGGQVSGADLALVTDGTDSTTRGLVLGASAAVAFFVLCASGLLLVGPEEKASVGPEEEGSHEQAPSPQAVAAPRESHSSTETNDLTDGPPGLEIQEALQTPDSGELIQLECTAEDPGLEALTLEPVMALCGDAEGLLLPGGSSMSEGAFQPTGTPGSCVGWLLDFETSTLLRVEWGPDRPCLVAIERPVTVSGTLDGLGPGDRSRIGGCRMEDVDVDDLGEFELLVPPMGACDLTVSRQRGDEYGEEDHRIHASHPGQEIHLALHAPPVAPGLPQPFAYPVEEAEARLDGVEKLCASLADLRDAGVDIPDECAALFDLALEDLDRSVEAEAGGDPDIGGDE